jgi:hypothetical protein
MKTSGREYVRDWVRFSRALPKPRVPNCIRGREAVVAGQETGSILALRATHALSHALVPRAFGFASLQTAQSRFIPEPDAPSDSAPQFAG